MSNTILYDVDGVAHNSAAKLLKGLLGGPVRLIKVIEITDDKGNKKYEPVLDVFGRLEITDPGGTGEYIVFSSSPDTARSNINPQFHIAQLIRTQPGNPNEILILDREPVGLI